jgi:hypothetical protein
MKTNSFEGLQELVYSGQMEHKQFPTISIVDYTYLSPVQTELYMRLIKGLDKYTPQELYAMNSAKKIKIKKKHLQAQRILNTWKQELTNELTNKLLLSLFPKSKLVKDLTDGTFTSTNFVNTLSFKDLRITKADVINKFIQSNLLPHNFATL